ncbi:hypothetical protein [Geobacter sp.]|uniref:hypothetical protein n=1 Tax=Geobacter sp. TaxID=46610 RepID=UPI002602989C|nr:hypothetical protein [Geobacter sp.]
MPVYKAKHVAMILSLTALLLISNFSGYAVAQTQTYSRKGTLNCGKAIIEITSSCLDINTNFPMCSEQKITIIDKITNKTTTTNTSSDSYIDEALTGYKGGKLLDGLATSWQCANGKENKAYLVLDFANGGNCEYCEWTEIYDLSGKIIASTKNKKNRGKFDKNTQKLKIKVIGDKTNIPLGK